MYYNIFRYMTLGQYKELFMETANSSGAMEEDLWNWKGRD